jgi:hypothetical protein
MIINPYTNTGAFNCGPIQNLDFTIGAGTANFNVPFDGVFNFSECANLYLAASLGATKQIRRVGFFFEGGTASFPYVYSDTEIWLAHTSLNEFPTGTTVGYPAMGLTNLTRCFKKSWTIPSSTGQWVFAEFDQNFCYNGTSNLVVIAKNLDGSYQLGPPQSRNTSLSGGTAGTTYRQVSVSQDPSYPANGTAMSRAQRVTNLRLWF